MKTPARARYNSSVLHKTVIRGFLFLALLAGILQPAGPARADRPVVQPAALAQDSGVTAFDLIIAMNTLRVSYGLPALIEDPIIDAVAQSTAQIMADSQMSWHIGNVSGRIQSAGYGGGAKVWATENFAVGTSYSIDEIMLVWADDSHMIPAVNPAYCNVGAGVAKSANGMTYYVLQAAYTTAKACGEYKPPSGGKKTPGASSGGATGGVSQLIVPVKIAEPDKDGKIFHVVQAGQSFWSIAVAYKITIKDLEVWNNLSKDSKLQIGQKLFIPSANTKGYATPTPVGMIQLATPEADGKIVHTVQNYQTLSTISQAYSVKMDAILALNHIKAEWPLQVGQKLIIHGSNVTPSPTPRPLTPLQKLTPGADGKYYHTVKSGETLSWIAGLYEVQVTDLMAWNGMNDASMLAIDRKLVLQVTPPATVTFTPAPPTATLPPTRTATPTLTATASPTQAATPATLVAATAAEPDSTQVVWIALAALAAGAILLIVIFGRKKPL